MMSPADIALRRLRSQRITGTTFRDPAELVTWLVASQAQDYAGAKWALGMRLRGATDDVVERAMTSGAILRTHLLRPTWHFVTPADIRWLLALTAPRIRAIMSPYDRNLELDEALFKRTHAAMVRALNGGRQLTRAELRVVLEKSGVEVGRGQRMGHIMLRAELDAIVCSGARRGKQFTYALLDERAPPTRPLHRDEALAELTRRYFISRGPATVHDLAKWSSLTIADVRKGLDAVRDQLREEQVNGRSYWMAPSDTATQTESPTAHLLSIYDEYVSSYKDRSAMGDAEMGAKLFRMGNALNYIIIIDGRIVGTWRRTLGKGSVEIETNVLTRLTKRDRGAIADAAHRYSEFLGLPVTLRARRPQ